MIANDELCEYMCKKHKYKCTECEANMPSSRCMIGICAFDLVEDCMGLYIKESTKS